MFKINTAVTGFGIGHFINATTGAAVTTGTPTCKRTLDGTGGACANAASYNTDGAVWEIDLDAADMNGDVVVLSFTLTDCLPISYTIRTSTKLVSDLNDYAGGDTSGTTTLLTRLSEARAGALTDWIDGGRLDLLLDAILADTNELQGNQGNWLTATGFAVPGSAMALTSGERTTLAAAIEAAIINELDGTAVMQAIADLIASDMTTGDLSVVAIATATRDAILNRVLAGNHDTASTVGLLLQYLDAAISSRGTSTLTEANVRTAIGLASANLDTQLAAIVGDTNTLQVEWADGGRLDLLLDTAATGSGSSLTMNTAVPTDGPANTLGHYLRVIDSVLGGKTNTDTANQVQFLDRDGTTVVRTITYGSGDGSRTASPL